MAANAVSWISVAFIREWPSDIEARVKTRVPVEVPLLVPTAEQTATRVDLGRLRESPVFYASRRSVVEEDTTELLASQPHYVLAAAMVVPKRVSVAYLQRAEGDANPVRVQEGDDLAGWTISRIEVRRVVATRGSLSVEIVPILHPTGQGLVRRATNGLPSTAGVRTLGATGQLHSPRMGPPRGSRLFTPPPAHPPPKGTKP